MIECAVALGVELFGVVLVINLRCFAAAAALWFFPE